MKKTYNYRAKALSRAELDYIYRRTKPNQFEIYESPTQKLEQLIKKVERKYEK